MSKSRPVIHWIGAGLSSVPGIRRLAVGELPLIVWNRTVDKAHEALSGLDGRAEVKFFDPDILTKSLRSEDIVVSMLPGNWHVPLAKICLAHGTNFVSSSYLTDEMRALHPAALDAGISLINEVGLDPGIDHLMAHLLVDAYCHDPHYDAGNEVSFRSYCGGFPAVANDFRYKFSWSPLGVLKALAAPAKSIRDSRTLTTERPWHAIVPYTVNFGDGRFETFEAYPNRDSLPFMTDYHFDLDWNVREFVRGTLRLDGWSSAWEPIFRKIESASGPELDRQLASMSDTLWKQYPYATGEADRVVLSVELEATKNGNARWHQGYVIDANGTESSSAMARLVSTTVALTVEALGSGMLPAGVHSAPFDTVLINRWFEEFRKQGDIIRHLDFLENDD
jgi:saccharopine dehydrogenase-like NADP-dependent oxidoreductase